MISKRKSFIVGLKSTKLSNNEILFLKKYKPWGIILFTRNIKSFDQVKKLTSCVRKIFKDKKYPIMIDQEGGRVNRLRNLISFDNMTSEYFGKLYESIPLAKIPLTESLKDTYNRVVPFYNKKISHLLKSNKNIIISAHGNSLRALCKFLFNISETKINELEIPTGNPMHIKFNKKSEVSEACYLDPNRRNEIFFNK